MTTFIPPGVSPEIAAERGYTHVKGLAQLHALEPRFTEWQQQTPGLLTPQYRLGQTPVHAWSLRPEKPRIDRNGKVIKYEQPQGIEMCLDVLPRYRDALADPKTPIIITEGAKKADALASAFGAAIVPINISGVWAWQRKQKDGASKPLDDFADIVWAGRDVVLAFDNDVLRKPDVQKALKALAKYLRSLGAKVRVLYLPDGDEKMGVDDAIAAGMSAAELLSLVGDLKDLPKQSHSDKLLSIGFSADLFKTPDGEPYARCAVNGHHEAYSISERGGGFRHWLVDSFFAEEDRPPSNSALAGAIEVFRARATMRGRIREVHTRAAWHDGCLYLDLTNDAYEVVKVDAEGWQIVTDPPVIFRRAHGVLPLPHPEAGGTLDELRPLLNLSNNDDWILLIGWTLGTFLPNGAYPHLALDGEQGSAKTTTTRMLRGLIDPNNAPARSVPKDEQDLAIAARNALVVVCDNASRLSDEMSDALCRLSTGAAFSTRTLYTNDDETILSFKRPVIMNGITEFITRGDLADRTLMVNLRAIPEAARKPEDELWSAYEERRPRLLGALLDAVSTAIRNRNMPRPARLPRMADFALWVERASGQLGWESGAFIAAYGRMRNDTSGALIEASPIAQTVLKFAEDEGRFVGTADELLQRLNKMVDKEDRPKGWPTTARALADALRRMAPPAYAAGVSLEFKRSHGTRLWTVQTINRANAGADAGAAEASQGADSADAESEIGTHSKPAQSPIAHSGAAGAAEFTTLSVQTPRKNENQEDRNVYPEHERENANSAAPAAPAALSPTGQQTRYVPSARLDP